MPAACSTIAELLLVKVFRLMLMVMSPAGPPLVTGPIDCWRPLEKLLEKVLWPPTVSSPTFTMMFPEP